MFDSDVESGPSTQCYKASNEVDPMFTFRVKSAVAGRATQILSDVEGYVKAGDMVALMGPSGSGKTTLLDILAMRSSLKVDAELFLNDKAMTQSELRKLSEYVEQEDKLIGCITVRETLKFAAALSLPADMTSRERIQRVDEMIRNLGLQNQAGTIIGTALQKGCSGGQKRRVTVGSQLITSPSILFLDEVTSGLDSVASSEVVKAIRGIAKANNMMVICSIHQPSTKTFNMFDSVLLLSKGKQVYFGPVQHIEHYFASIGREVPPYYNPAEYCLDVTNTDFEDNAHAVETLEALWKSWETSQDRVYVSATIDAARTQEKAKEFENDLKSDAHSGITRRPGLLSHIITLTHRGFLKSYRDLLPYWVRVAMYLGLALLMGTVWLRLSDGQENIQNYFNALFFGAAFLSFMAVAYVPAFLEDRAAFIKERNGGLYGATAFLVSNIIIGLPYLFLISLLFSVISYWMINFNPDARSFFRYLMFLFLDLIAAESLVVLCSSIWPNFIGALVITAFSNGLWMSVGGFLVEPSVLNVFWRNTVYWINYQRFVFEGMVFNEFKDRTYSCGGGCRCMYASPLNDVCRIDGRSVLAAKGYGGDHTGLWIGLLFAIIASMRLIAWALLRYKN